MQIVILVQHGQAYHHVLPEAKLWPDIRNGLTSKGQRQAQCAATRLLQEVAGRPCQVYTSAMRRATETAKILTRELLVTAEPVPDLHEFNGRFAMERTRNGEEWTIDNSNWSLFDWRPFPEAETWREFHTRVAAAMDRLAGTCSDTTLPILVVHGGTLSNIVVWWLGLPLDALPERTCFAASPGSLSILQRNRHGKPVIERLNDCAHLATLGAGG